MQIVVVQSCCCQCPPPRSRKQVHETSMTCCCSFGIHRDRNLTVLWNIDDNLHTNLSSMDKVFFLESEITNNKEDRSRTSWKTISIKEVLSHFLFVCLFLRREIFGVCGWLEKKAMTTTFTLNSRQETAE